MISLKTINRRFASLILLLAGLVVAIFLADRTAGYDVIQSEQDIHFIYIEGQRLINGENPYARILQGNMVANDKYATYFPLFYYFSAAVQWVGFDDEQSWLAFMRTIFIGTYFLIGIMIFYWYYEQQQLMWGVFSSYFWLFNRWSLKVLHIVHIDFVPVLLLLLSFYFISKRPRLSLLLLGFSLAIKHIGVLILPIYLIYYYKTRKIRLGEASIWLTAVPLITSMPFIFWNLEGFVKSILFSLTRYPSDHFYSPDPGFFLGLIGLKAKLFMLVLLLLVWYGFYRSKLTAEGAMFFVFLVFICFNSVLFAQYLIWPIAFALLLPLQFKKDVSF